jgi:hypothetical protein
MTKKKKSLPKLKSQRWLGIVLHICNPNTRETEAGGAWVESQPELHGKTLTLKQNQKYSKDFSPRFSFKTFIALGFTCGL